MRVKGGGELVCGRGPDADLVIAKPDQSLQLAQPGFGRLQPAKPVPRWPCPVVVSPPTVPRYRWRRGRRTPASGETRTRA